MQDKDTYLFKLQQITGMEMIILTTNAISINNPFVWLSPETVYACSHDELKSFIGTQVRCRLVEVIAFIPAVMKMVKLMQK